MGGSGSFCILSFLSSAICLRDWSLLCFLDLSTFLISFVLWMSASLLSKSNDNEVTVLVEVKAVLGKGVEKLSASQGQFWHLLS